MNSQNCRNKSYNIKQDLPKGKTEPKANLKCCIPQGMPIIVQQSSSPQIRCTTAISHQPRKIHSTLNRTFIQPLASALGTRSCPKGQSAILPILNSCTPKGIPIMVQHKSSPANQYIKAVTRPPIISQTRLPRKFIPYRFLLQRYNFFCEYTNYDK